MIEQDRIWILLARKLAGEASDTDGEEFYNLLLKYPHLQEKVNIIVEFWNKVGQPVESTHDLKGK